VSTGGVAGVGETIRRISWRRARIDDAMLHLDLDVDEFDRAERIEKDQWPAH